MGAVLVALALALVGGTLVLFQRLHQEEGTDMRSPGANLRARRELFQHDAERQVTGQQEVTQAEVSAAGGPPDLLTGGLRPSHRI